jgi:predicted transcriptional regulator
MPKKLSEKELFESAKDDTSTIIARKLRRFDECKTLYRLLVFFKGEEKYEYITPSSFSQKFKMDYNSADKTIRGFWTMGFLIRREVSTPTGKRYHYFPAPSKKEFILFKYATKITECWEAFILKKKNKLTGVVGVLLAGVVGVVLRGVVVGALGGVGVVI